MLGEHPTAQNARFEVQQAEKEVKASKSVTKWLGENHMNSLLHMTGRLNEDDLHARVSIYAVVVDAEKSMRIRLFQAFPGCYQHPFGREGHQGFLGHDHLLD